MTGGSILAVDLGGTVIKAGRVYDGRVVQRASIASRSELGIAQALPRLALMLHDLRQDDTAGIAIALPTLVDSRQGKVLVQMKGKFDGLVDADLQAWCIREFGLPLRIENDAHAALLGEWRFGAGRDCDDLVMITLGTGIGTSVLIGGKPLRGRHGQTGNLGGHVVVDPNGFNCVCGGQGCIEAQQHLCAVEQIARSDARFVSSALRSAEQIDYATLFALRDTDDLARDLLTRTLDLWGILVVTLIHQFDPTRVLVGGGIMRSRDVILPHLQTFAGRACTPGRRVEVGAASLGDDAALVGLASLFSHPPEFI
ncbi:MAG: ROK family protein [Tepidisphaeraceae bacterium]